MAKSPTPIDGAAADTSATDQSGSSTDTSTTGAADASTADAGTQADDDQAVIASTTEVRVIRDQGEHRVNDVVEIPNADLLAAVEGGWADANAAAVAYAKSLKA